MGSIPSGERADGTQQRLRFGLGEFKPYRWRGIPGWNPANVLPKRTSRRQRPCPKCDAKAGQLCLARSGKPMRSYHTER